MFPQFIILLFIASAASALQVKFKDCAHHEISLIEVIGCVGNNPNVCPLPKGKDFKLTMNFVANQDSAKAAFRFTADVGGIKIPVPGIDSDACHHLKCPLVKGEKYAYTFTMQVPKIVPNLKAVVRMELVGDHGALTCADMNGGVSD